LFGMLNDRQPQIPHSKVASWLRTRRESRRTLSASQYGGINSDAIDSLSECSSTALPLLRASIRASKDCVYEHVLGSHAVHVLYSPMKRRLEHVLCSRESALTSGKDNVFWWDYCHYDIPGTPKPNHGVWFELLFSCKQM
jgi:hypothetical protein